MLSATIAGLGRYLPPRRVTSTELEIQLELPRGWIERTTGVRERRYAQSETSAGMAAVAARMALERARLGVDAIDAIIGASAAPQQSIPCTAALVQRELSCPDGGSVCFDINATCLSFMVALHTAAQFIAAGVYRTVLVYSSEIASRSLNYREPESATLFGDAAVAAIVTGNQAGQTGGVWHAQFATYSSGADHTQCVGGGTLHHPNDPNTTFAMNTFHMQGLSVFRHAVREMRPFLDRFFTTLDWDRRDVDVVVPHQASRHAVEQLTARFGFQTEQVWSNLLLRGNCVAASIPLALCEAVEAGRIKRGDRVVLVGSGAGLSLGAMALTF